MKKWTAQPPGVKKYEEYKEYFRLAELLIKPLDACHWLKSSQVFFTGYSLGTGMSQA